MTVNAEQKRTKPSKGQNNPKQICACARKLQGQTEPVKVKGADDANDSRYIDHFCTICQVETGFRGDFRLGSDGDLSAYKARHQNSNRETRTDMFFILSKILAFVLTPHLHSVFCLFGAALCSVFKAKRLARTAVFLAACLPVIYSWTFVGELLVRPLENYAALPASEQVDNAAGIIVLGGFTGSPVISEARREAQISVAGERFIKAVELATSYPEKPVWFSGFSAQLRPRGWSEAEITKRLIAQLGLPSTRFSFEDKSRNTAQNAAFMLDKVRPDAGESWVLVTSASHMKRAMASFRSAGWTELIPYPVDFQTTADTRLGIFSPSQGFALIKTALHEYIGYLAYWLAGKI